MTVSRRRGLRVVGWAAAYLLALQTILASFLAIPNPASAAYQDSPFVLCLAQGATDDGGTAAPAVIHHCAACVVAAVTLTAPHAAASRIIYEARPAYHETAVATPASRAPDPRPGLPRAPPSLA